MGSVYRYYRCRDCYSKHIRVEPDVCRKCGGSKFNPTPWQVDTQVGHKRIRKALPGATKAEAQRILSQIESQAIADEHELRPKGAMLLLDFIEQYYRPMVVSAMRSKRNVEYELSGRILPEWGNKPLSKILAMDIEGWRARLRDEGLKPSSVNRLMSRMSSVFTTAVRYKELKYHPMKGQVDQLQESNERVSYLTSEQYRQLMTMIDGMDWLEPVKVNMKAAVTLAIQTGLRKSNLFELRWDVHVDMDRRLVTIPGTQTKNQDAVRQPMFDVTRRTLESLPRELHSKHVFTSVRGRGFAKYMQNHWRQLQKKMDDHPEMPTGFHWHDLRHTCATWLKMADVDDSTIMRILNLKSTRVLERYRHHDQKQVFEAGNKIANLFGDVTMESPEKVADL
jgi:integrase